MNKYKDTEIKILNINVGKVKQNLQKIGAKEVFSGNRIRTTFDNGKLISDGVEIRITEEGTIKLSLDENKKDGTRISIKTRLSGVSEMEAILSKLNIMPVSRVKSYRISYQLNEIDFDIDLFPEIPPFIEIDTNGDENKMTNIIDALELTDFEKFTGSTIDLYNKYGKDYIKLFSISKTY